MEKVCKFVYFYIKTDFLRVLQIWEKIKPDFSLKRNREHCKDMGSIKNRGP
jgi:hypothetical protein